MNHERRSVLATATGFCLGGCANVAPDIDSAQLTFEAQRGLLVGRAVFYRNGTLWDGPAIANRWPHLVVVYLRPFTSIADLARGSMVAGAMAVRARLADNGLFAIKLAPGRYYVDQFTYTALGPAGTAYRPYGSMAGQSTRLRQVILMDVSAGRASYSGTLVHEVVDIPGKGYEFAYRVVDESPYARGWMERRVPVWSAVMDVRLAQTLPFEAA